MANRCYLYSTNTIPETQPDSDEVKITGISEWPYEIPFVYKLLISANTKICNSIIWDTPHKIALIGDYNLGFAKLKNFFDQIQSKSLAPFITEAIEFLSKESNADKYFVLEPGEIFDMDEEPIPERTKSFIQELLYDIDTETEMMIKHINEKMNDDTNLFQKLFKKNKSKIDPKQVAEDMGLCYWSNFLYYDFSQDNS